MVNRKKLKGDKASSKTNANELEIMKKPSFSGVKLLVLAIVSLFAGFTAELGQVARVDPEENSLPMVQYCQKFWTEKALAQESHEENVPLIENTLCSNVDLFFLRNKFANLATYTIYLTAMVVLVWRQDHMLRRLCSFLSTVPFLVSLLILTISRGVVEDWLRLKYTFITTLVVTITVNVTKSPMAQMRRFHTVSPVDVGLLLNSLLEMSLMIGMLVSKEGAAIYTTYPPDLLHTPAIKLVYRLTALDHGAMAMLFTFGLLYIDGNKKSAFLLIAAAIKLYQMQYLMPLIEKDLQFGKERSLAVVVSCIISLFMTLLSLIPSSKSKTN